MEKYLIFYLFQLSLLNKITPDLRAIYAEVNQKTFEIFFYYNKFSEIEKNLINESINTFKTDLLKHDVDLSVKCSIQVIPDPEKYEKNGLCVYKRWEGSY